MLPRWSNRIDLSGVKMELIVWPDLIGPWRTEPVPAENPDRGTQQKSETDPMAPGDLGIVHEIAARSAGPPPEK